MGYWTNIETGLSTSIRPTSGIIPKKQEAPKADVPSGWVEKLDGGTGTPYWVNTSTGLSTSIRPTSSVGTTKESIRPTSSVGTTKEKTQEAAPVGSGGVWKENSDGPGPPYWTNIETGLSTSIRPTSGVIPKKQEAPKTGVPSGWVEKFDGGTGTPYWVNTSTGLSTSIRPTSSVGTTKEKTQEAASVDSPGT